MNLEVKMYWNS